MSVQCNITSISISFTIFFFVLVVLSCICFTSKPLRRYFAILKQWHLFFSPAVRNVFLSSFLMQFSLLRALWQIFEFLLVWCFLFCSSQGRLLNNQPSCFDFPALQIFFYFVDLTQLYLHSNPWADFVEYPDISQHFTLSWSGVLWTVNCHEFLKIIMGFGLEYNVDFCAQLNCKQLFSAH